MLKHRPNWNNNYIIYMQNMAYEYASRGACLALCARREDRLQEVADRCRHIGSPDVIVIRADVANAHDCKRVVDQTVHHFNRCTQFMHLFSTWFYVVVFVDSNIMVWVMCMQWIIWWIMLGFLKSVCWKKLLILRIYDLSW